MNNTVNKENVVAIVKLLIKTIIGQMLMNIVCSQLKPKLQMKVDYYRVIFNYHSSIVSHSAMTTLNCSSFIPKMWYLKKKMQSGTTQ